MAQPYPEADFDHIRLGDIASGSGIAVGRDKIAQVSADSRAAVSDGATTLADLIGIIERSAPIGDLAAAEMLKTDLRHLIQSLEQGDEYDILAMRSQIESIVASVPDLRQPLRQLVETSSSISGAVRIVIRKALK